MRYGGGFVAAFPRDLLMAYWYSTVFTVCGFVLCSLFLFLFLVLVGVTGAGGAGRRLIGFGLAVWMVVVVVVMGAHSVV